jgi:hypothetical protein
MMSKRSLLSAVVLIPVILVVGLALFWSHTGRPTSAAADVVLTGTVDAKMKALPELKVHDMTFVYTDGD